MGLQSGDKLGAYEILAQIGKGGMGEVYRARDPRLGRDVAVKVSTEQFSERFEREARSIASLNHPNICTLHDIGPNYLVMELVEGETLAARLKKGKLSIADTLRYGAQIAEALAEAHSKKITHRDLKPGNVMLGKNGVKVLDFGLARVDGDETLTVPMMVVGTPAYMPPEQAEGSVCDARTDIFALGLILYEMATGKRSPRGEAPQVDGLPDRLGHIIERCVPQDPAERWQSASDVSRELTWATKAPAVPGSSPPGLSGRRLWGAAAGLGLFVFAATLAISRFASPAASPDQSSFQIFPPEGGAFPSPANPDQEIMAISPDGLRIAFSAIVRGQTRLWIRERSQITARPLAGTEGAMSPFWSPDSRSVGFFADGKLKRIEADGGPPTVVCEVATTVATGTWGTGGDILYTDISGGIFRVSAEGGIAKPVAKPDSSRNEQALSWPEFLPDGKRFLYLAWHPDMRNQIMAASVAGGEPKLLLQESSRVAYVSPGYLLFVREGSLLAQRFDVDSLRVEGTPIPIVEQIEYFQPNGMAPFSVSTNGVLAYQGATGASRLAWLDRGGRELAAVAPAVGAYSSSRLSPDDKKLVVARSDPRSGSEDLYVIELSSGTSTRITSDSGSEFMPVWSPDGGQIVFSWDNNAVPYLHQIALDGAGVPQAVTAPSGQVQMATAWLRDGSILYQDIRPETFQDILLLPGQGERKPRAILASRFNETMAVVSPDGRWIAYVSDDSGSPEVYVRSFPQIGAPRSVSKNGGTNPRWARNGREMYFIEGDRLMAAPAEAGSATLLFQQSPGIVDYDVASDGRFLVNIGRVVYHASPINVVVNWTEALKR